MDRSLILGFILLVGNIFLMAWLYAKLGDLRQVLDMLNSIRLMDKIKNNEDIHNLTMRVSAFEKMTVERFEEMSTRIEINDMKRRGRIERQIDEEIKIFLGGFSKKGKGATLKPVKKMDGILRMPNGSKIKFETKKRDKSGRFAGKAKNKKKNK